LLLEGNVAESMSAPMPTTHTTASSEAPNDPDRHESEAQRIDRNLSELLQELRVASIGVQVLFGFLLSLPFTTRFAALSAAQRDLYLVDILLAALATALLSAPVAFHRLSFRQHAKARVLRASNRLAIAGLAAVALAISGSVLLVVSFVETGTIVPLLAILTFAMFVVLWFVVPITRRGRDDY
jgi:Family of unknown function (DUF6328)